MSSDGTISFAQISDLHLSTLPGLAPGWIFSKRLLGYLSWFRKRRHEHSLDVLQALRHDLARDHVDRLLISGDLTHLGLPDEFRQARSWLDEFAADTVSVVPGNHDSYVAESWSDTYARWTPYFTSDGRATPGSAAEAFPSLTIRGGTAFIGLSSALPTPPLFATGKLGTVQLQKLERLLSETGDKGLFRVIYLHHPPFPGMEKWRKRLCDSRQLQEVIERHGAELILFGHTHKRQAREVNSGGKSVLVMGAASTSARGGHGEVASYHYFRLSAQPHAWQLSVDHRLYDPATHQFLSDGQQHFEIAR